MVAGVVMLEEGLRSILSLREDVLETEVRLKSYLQTKGLPGQCVDASFAYLVSLQRNGEDLEMQVRAAFIFVES